MNYSALSLVLLLWMLQANSYAEVYRWVDEKGVTHFGDTLPDSKNAAAKADKITLRGKHFYGHVKALQPIKYVGPNKAPLILFQAVKLKLKNANRKDLEIGTHTTASSSNCTSPRPIIWSDGFVDVSESQMMSDVIVSFKEQGYRMITGTLMNVSGATSRLSLTATINQLRIEVCDRVFSTKQAPSQKAAVYMSIHWKLADRLTRQVVYEGNSEGAENAFDRFKSNGAKKAVNRTLAMAARNLMADKLFISRVQSVSSKAVATEEFAALNIVLNYGKADSTFKQKIRQLKQSAVTVRTGSGHGSGVLLNQQGYILTNAHVTGDNKEVIIILDDYELRGEVLRREPIRDVALVRIRDLSTASGVAISKEQPSEGDNLYVIGTPLDESLSHTVTKGILSATRQRDGQSYYQTDAAINPGNSGGPVFNEKGELVAISVAGVFTQTGASLNVNYLIPINTALQALHLEANPDISYLLEVEPASRSESDKKANNRATELYLQALQLKRQDNYEAARETLRRAMAASRKGNEEFDIIRDELNIELPLAQARYALTQGDNLKVNELLEPVVGILKEHPKRIVFMKQVEEIRNGLKFLKKTRNIAADNTAETLKRVLQQYQSRNGQFPQTLDELKKYLQQYQQLSNGISVQSYTAEGQGYTLEFYDKRNKRRQRITV